jgi:hypothetical protein
MARPSFPMAVFLGSMAAGFLALGVSIAVLTWAVDGTLWVGALWLGIDAALIAVFLWAYRLYRRALPGGELAWAAAPYESWFDLGFEAPSRKVHVWLNLDLDSELRRGGELLLLDIEVTCNQQTRPVVPFVFSWRAHIKEAPRPTPPGRQLVRVTLHEKLTYEGRSVPPTGHFRCLARIAKLGVARGDVVRVRGCIHGSTARLRSFRAEAFVA